MTKLTEEQKQWIRDNGEQVLAALTEAEVEKWEPPEGELWVGSDGIVRSGSSDDDSRLHGNERSTKEQAEAFAKRQRVFNRMEAYIDQYSEDGEERNYSVVMYGPEIWKRDCSCATQPGIPLMPERVAKQMIEDINSGRFDPYG